MEWDAMGHCVGRKTLLGVREFLKCGWHRYAILLAFYGNGSRKVYVQNEVDQQPPRVH